MIEQLRRLGDPTSLRLVELMEKMLAQQDSKPADDERATNDR